MGFSPDGGSDPPFLSNIHLQGYRRFTSALRTSRRGSFTKRVDSEPTSSGGYLANSVTFRTTWPRQSHFLMSTKPEAAPRTGSDRAKQVRSIFSDIAPRYDLLNHVLSMNVDKGWRRKAVDALDLSRAPGGIYLDACCGTFDLSIEIADRPEFTGSVVAADFARPMLVTGQHKLQGRAVDPVCADSLQLPFPDGSFDGLTVGFGVRNLSDLAAGLAEFRRVLKPGGRAVILECSVPPNAVVRSGYLLYFNHILPVVGRVVSGHPWAYTYLPNSVREFPPPNELGDLLTAVGFDSVRWSLLSLGIAALHVAEIA